MAASIMTLGGAAASSYGTYSAGKYNKSISKFNTKIAELQAKDALRRGGKDIAQTRSTARQVIGAQRTALASQGIDVDVGSAADVQEDTMIRSEIDVNTIRNNAAREAWGFKVQATSGRLQSGLDSMEANNRAVSGLMTAGSQSAYYVQQRK